MHSPYSALAAHYATVMAEVPYTDWFEYVRGQITPANGRLAELFCGPGAMADAAEARGFQVTRLDASWQSLQTGRGERVLADAQYLPFRADVFACLLAANGSLNYLSDTEALAGHFEECSQVLLPGGIYAFDICTVERAYALHARTFSAASGQVSFSHRFSPADCELLSAVQVMTESGVVTELHRQRIFTGAEIREAAAQAGLEPTAHCENYALPVSGENPPMETYILKKA